MLTTRRLVKNLICFALICTLVVSIAEGESKDSRGNQTSAPFYIVSMYRLIAAPEAFNSKNVVLSGYFAISNQVQTLYANETAFRHGYVVDAVSLRMTADQVVAAKELNGKWGFVEGTFHAFDVDDSLRFTGFLDQITRFKKMDD